MLYVDINDELDISASKEQQVKLQFGHNYLFMSPNLLSKDVLSLLYIKALQSEYPVTMISKDSKTLVNLNILHKIYRKSKKMEFKNMLYNLQNRQTYTCVPDFNYAKQNGYKNGSDSLYIQFIDVDNLLSIGFDVYQFTNPNAINIFFSKKNNLNVSNFSQVFSDYDSNSLLFTAERDIYSKIHGMIHNENLLDDESINILDSEFKSIFKEWLSNNKNNISSFNSLLLSELSNEQQVDAIGEMVTTLKLEIEKRIVKATKEVFIGLVEFEDIYNFSFLFESLDDETYNDLISQEI